MISTTLDNPTDTGEHTERDYPYLETGYDPRKLTLVGNSRLISDIRDQRPDLVASIIEHGVSTRVSVIPVVPKPDGGFRVLNGFSRAAAAVTVRKNERPDLTVTLLVNAPGTRADDVISQAVENFHRLGFTQQEEADLYHQLELEGFTDEDIAQSLSRPLPRVTAGLAVAKSRRAHDDAEQIDLFTRAKLIPFEDNEKAYTRLLNVIRNQPSQLDHRIAEEHLIRERDAALAQQLSTFAERGYGVVEDEYDPPEGTEPIADLCSESDTTPLVGEDHGSCPGRAVNVEVARDLSVEITEFCTNYREHGHRRIVDVAIAAEEDRLRGEGLRIVDPDDENITGLSRLFADPGAETTLAVTEHAECPGHAAYVEESGFSGKPLVTYVCVDFAAHGHVLHRAERVEQSPAFVAGERTRTRKYNAAFAEAKERRRAFLTWYFTGWAKRKAPETARPKTAKPSSATKRKTAKAPDDVPVLPAGVQRWLAEASVLVREYLVEASPDYSYASTLLGVPAGVTSRSSRDNHPIVALLGKKTTTEHQALWIQLAMVVGACEEHWDRAYTSNADSSWRSPTTDSRFYFRLLKEALSLTLEPVEELFIDPTFDHDLWPHLSTEGAAQDAADDGEPDTADEVADAVPTATDEVPATA